MYSVDDHWVRGPMMLNAGTVSYLHMHTLVELHGWLAELMPLPVGRSWWRGPPCWPTHARGSVAPTPGRLAADVGLPATAIVRVHPARTAAHRWPTWATRPLETRISLRWLSTFATISLTAGGRHPQPSDVGHGSRGVITVQCGCSVC